MTTKQSKVRVKTYLVSILILSMSSFGCGDKQLTGKVVITNCDGGDDMKVMNFKEHQIYFTSGFETDTISVSYDKESIDTIISTDPSLGLAYRVVIPTDVPFMLVDYRLKEYRIRLIHDSCFVYLSVHDGAFDVCHTNSA